MFSREVTTGSIILPMKPLPAPQVPGNTDAERFDNALRKVLSVSKEEVLRREAAEKQERTKSSPSPSGC